MAFRGQQMGYRFLPAELATGNGGVKQEQSASILDCKELGAQ
jgi:hypothetical protein